ncbi:hypothetical protein RHGRI_035402 [Rhododendron griersonianum]|uniref:Uncharacterized protein n=1 Tax=Rhododendron griersonianum TaxID=479676 RepID=A0AAV6I935_9ERIC|nr:hypothetical protein RHGRI_035402 [Rhododendron griersonianum]
MMILDTILSILVKTSTGVSTETFGEQLSFFVISIGAPKLEYLMSTIVASITMSYDFQGS